MLNKLENNIRTIENRVAQFCNSEWCEMRMICDFPYAIVSQDVMYVKVGQQIQVTAGVGWFSNAYHPQFIINKQPVKAGPEGVAEYTFSASSHYGKHLIPVKVTYAD